MIPGELTGGHIRNVPRRHRYGFLWFTLVSIVMMDPKSRNLFGMVQQGHAPKAIKKGLAMYKKMFDTQNQ